MTITTILLCIILESDNGSLNTIIIIMITIIIIIRMLVNTCELIGQHNHQALITEQFELHLSQNNIRMANHTLFDTMLLYRLYDDSNFQLVECHYILHVFSKLNLFYRF